jgi:Do/DeqQ family serine protease
MKIKIVITTAVVTILGMIITLFVYTHLITNSKQIINNPKNGSDEKTSPAMWTSMQVQEGPVDLTYAAEQTVHAVVHVRVRSTVNSGDETDNPLFEFFYGNNARQQPRKVTGFGSGVIISPDGYIITNNHVVEGADSIQVTLNNNKTYNAKLVGRDPDTDIALLKIKAENLPTIKYGDSDKLKLGEWVLAVGNPFNLTSTVTAGIISAKGRSLDLDGSYKIESFIQTDAALNMGNSGGALVNTKAELVGITSAIISPTGTYSGNSFAIPVNIVKKAVSDLRQYGKVQRAVLGVNIQQVTSDIAQKEKLENVSGVYVASVTPGGAAEEAGIRARDVIVKINDVNIGSPAQLQETVSEHHPGDKIKVTYSRSGRENMASVELKNIDGSTEIVHESIGETVLGCKIMPLNAQDKKKYSVDFGAKVTEVGEGKLRELGIKRGTIISVINGKNVNNASEIREATSDGENLKSIEGIQPDGTYFSYQFKN